MMDWIMDFIAMKVLPFILIGILSVVGFVLFQGIFNPSIDDKRGYHLSCVNGVEYIVPQFSISRMFTVVQNPDGSLKTCEGS